MRERQLYKTYILVIKGCWTVYFINLIVQLILCGGNMFNFVLVQATELIILLTATYIVLRRKWPLADGPRSLENILDELNVVTWYYEPHNNKFYISDGIEQISGYAASDFMQSPGLFKKLVHPYDVYRVGEAEKALLAGEKCVIEYRILTPDGETRWINNLAVSLGNKAGLVHRMEGLIFEVTREKELEEKMAQMAFYDALTGLPNRSMFKNYFTHFVTQSEYVPQKMAIVFIDLDSFKIVNDTLGHDKGDLLLKAIVARLRTIFRGTDLLSRLGGDEFIVLLTRISMHSLTMLIERIMQAFSEPFDVSGHRLTISASVGISICPDDGQDLETLIRNADQAMYVAKSKGKNTYHFYNQNLKV